MGQFIITLSLLFNDNLWAKFKHFFTYLEDSLAEILKGSLKTLASNQLKSFLVELDESKKNYKDSINLIQSSGLKLKEKIYVTEEGPFSTTANHIFIK